MHSPGHNPDVQGTVCSLHMLLHGYFVAAVERWGWEEAVLGLSNQLPVFAASATPLSHPAFPRTTSPDAPLQGLEDNIEYIHYIQIKIHHVLRQ